MQRLAVHRRAAATRRPTSNNLRVFTYEGNETIDLLKAQIKKFDEAERDHDHRRLPARFRCRGLSGQAATELLGGSGPDVWRIWGGQIGAPYAKAKQALDLAPTTQKFGWDSKINTAADRAG